MTQVTEAFSRASRLTEQVEFRRVFARPAVSQDRCFRVLSRRNDQSQTRLGMAVSIKACKQAVGRNRIKRLVRESFRRHPWASSGGPALDIVVLPTRQAASMCNATLSQALEKHWLRSSASASTANPSSDAPQGTN